MLTTKILNEEFHLSSESDIIRYLYATGSSAFSQIIKIIKFQFSDINLCIIVSIKIFLKLIVSQESMIYAVMMLYIFSIECIMLFVIIHVFQIILLIYWLIQSNKDKDFV